MSKIRSKDTKPEVWLRKRLFNCGYRYRKNVNNVVGHPDIWMLYMAFQKGTQTAPHGGIMPPQAGISTARNGNSGCAGRRLTVAGHGGIMNPLLLMYKTGQRWRAT